MSIQTISEKSSLADMYAKREIFIGISAKAQTEKEWDMAADEVLKINDLIEQRINSYLGGAK